MIPAFIRVLRSSSLPQEQCPVHGTLPPPTTPKEREDGQYSSSCWLNHLLQAPGDKSAPQRDPPSNAGHPSRSCLAQLVLSQQSPPTAHPADELPIGCQSTLESRYNPRWPHLACLTHPHLSDSHTKPSWSAWHALPSPSSATRAQTSSISHPSVLYQRLARCQAHSRSSTKYSPSE